MSDTHSGPRPAGALLVDELPPELDRLPAGSPGDEEIAVPVGKTR